MKNRKEEIRKAMLPLRAELEEIEKAETRERNQALVGKCFKYRNSFGSESRWWLYLLVIDAGDYWPMAFSFQKDSNGRFEIEPCRQFLNESDGYKEISRAEFDGAWENMKAEINTLPGVNK